MSHLFSKLDTKSESFAHKVIKQLIYKQVLKHNTDIVGASLEKYFGERRADVYFKFKSGKEVIVEIQNSQISSKEITQRTKDYNLKDIYVLWILYGQGNCVGSVKIPAHEKDKKISPAEMRIHHIYRGRVYYVNINSYEDRTTATKPYALCFSNSDKIKPVLFKKHFDSFFIRNVNFLFIPNWNLMCKTYNKYKIARFYDKHSKYALANMIKQLAIRYNVFREKKYKKKKYTKKFLKLINNFFQDEYGKFIILDAIIKLVVYNKLLLNKQCLVKYKKKLKKNAKKLVK
ncbi:MAG: competence protein CoiA family protein [Promethearchaeota archaeon]